MPHVGGRLVEHDLDQLGMGQGVALAAPAVERRDEVAQRRARLRLELFGRDDRPRRFGEGDAPGARVLVQALQGRVAEAAPGDVDDTFEGEVVGRRIDQAQIGERIADLGPLVEARSADHPIGQAEGDEPVFELAHLNEARTRIAISLSGWPARCSCSISSPTARASSSNPTTRSR